MVPAGVDLSRADLRGVNLRDADLQGADLHGASLDNPHLIEAKPRGTSLVGAYFSRMSLDGAEFLVDLTRRFLRILMMTNTKLLRANLTNYDHSGANLSNSDFKVANLSLLVLSIVVIWMVFRSSK